MNNSGSASQVGLTIRDNIPNTSSSSTPQSSIPKPWTLGINQFTGPIRDIVTSMQTSVKMHSLLINPVPGPGDMITDKDALPYFIILLWYEYSRRDEYLGCNDVPDKIPFEVLKFVSGPRS